MVAVPGFPYFAVEFDKRGRPAASGNAQVLALQGALASDAITDLIVISHGWNNNMEEAENLYQELLTNAREHMTAKRFEQLAERRFAVLGVLWPSKKFEEKELIASGSAGVVNTALGDAIDAKLDMLKGGFDAADGDATLEQLKKLRPQLEDSDTKCEEFVEKCRSLVQVQSGDDDAHSKSFFSDKPLEVFERLSKPASFIKDSLEVPPSVDIGGASGMPANDRVEEGEAAGVRDYFNGVVSAARNVLNLTTYYQMKERAGLIGSVGLKPLLKELRSQHPGLRMHLIGHSFGGRLVTATVAGRSKQEVLPVDSLILLQAAFSHHGLSSNWNGKGGKGFFCSVVELEAVSGPLVITHTRNDKAVGIAYPLASLLAGQDAAGLGDEDSRFGGIGRNGAQKMTAVEKIKMIKVSPVGSSYQLIKGRVHNVLSDDCIADHGDVRNPSVAGVVLAAIAAT